MSAAWTFSVPTNIFVTVRARTDHEARKVAARLVTRGFNATLPAGYSASVVRAFGVQPGEPLIRKTDGEVARHLELVDVLLPDGTLVVEPTASDVVRAIRATAKARKGSR